MLLVHGNYVYAGFSYWIEEDESQQLWAKPHEGQHQAATKDKHKRAAVEQFDEEYQWRKRIGPRDWING